MHGKTLQVSKLLAGLILIYIAGFSRAKYNFVGRDNGITTMKVTSGKGILWLLRKTKKPKAILDFQYFSNGIICILEHSLSVSLLPDEASQSAVEPEIARIGRIGSVGGSGSDCKVEGESCWSSFECCSRACAWHGGAFVCIKRQHSMQK